MSQQEKMQEQSVMHPEDEERIEVDTSHGVKTAINMIPRGFLKDREETRLRVQATLSGMKTIVGGLQRLRYRKEIKKEKKQTLRVAVYVAAGICLVLLILGIVLFFLLR